MTDRKPMRRCGKKFPSKRAALGSKRAAGNPLLKAEKCRCGSWHLRAPVKAAAPKAPATRARYDRGSVREAVRQVLAGEATVAHAAREAGCDPGYLDRRAWKDAKTAVLDRDGRQCANCPAEAVDVHHRIRRGMGGTDDPRVLYALVNLLSLCRACHALAEARDAEMHVRGMWLETWEQPEAEPVLYALPGGPAWLFLTPGGERSARDPEEATAA